MAHIFDRRKFLRETAIKASSFGLLPFVPNIDQPLKIEENRPFSSPIPIEPRIKFGVIGINHNHIYSMTTAIMNGGGELAAFYAQEDDLAQEFAKKFPTSKRVSSPDAIYDNSQLHLILSAAIPSQRAAIGIKAMQSGKDFMADKPGITSLKQLAEVKKVQQQTGRIFSIMYSERFENKATVKAGELVKSGAIGQVIQTIGLGPHRMNTAIRPPWFFNVQNYGGILTDIASHQFDQFLFFTGSTEAQIVAAQVGNVHNPAFPHFEDFGDVMLKGNRGMGYIRVDWFTPNGLKTWGDGRLTILGTEGYIEIRKNIDIAHHEKGNHLYLVNNKETVYMDCNQEPLPFGKQLVDDVLNRTQTAMSQTHCFLATELALIAQEKANKI
jgi:predicted dehydrogenase